MKTKHSATMRLMEIVYKHNREATGWSWERVNGSLRKALELCLKSGFRFAVDDFETIYKSMKGHYWFGTDNDHSQGEAFYVQAVYYGNISACQSFEKWKKREPFISEGRRLHHSALLVWNDEDTLVTSFAKDGLSLIACSYTQPIRPSWGMNCYYSQGKIKKRYKVNLSDLRASERTKEKAKKSRGQER